MNHACHRVESSESCCMCWSVAATMGIVQLQERSVRSRSASMMLGCSPCVHACECLTPMRTGQHDSQFMHSVLLACPCRTSSVQAAACVIMVLHQCACSCDQSLLHSFNHAMQRPQHPAAPYLPPQPRPTQPRRRPAAPLVPCPRHRSHSCRTPAPSRAPLRSAACTPPARHTRPRRPRAPPARVSLAGAATDRKSVV